MKDRGNDRGRLREIVSVLRKNKVYKDFTPVKFRMVIEELGPTFIKLGQLLSMREDMLPADYCRELSLLRTKAAGVSLDEIRQVVESEYKKPMEEVFAEFNEEPLGSASIAQVHYAVLKNGREVVVKVQRPGIKEVMEKDIILLRKAAGILNRTGIARNVFDFKGIIDEIWRVAQQEMDFITEAGHLEEFASNNKDIVYVAVPEVEKGLTTQFLLVMEYIDGIVIDNIEELKESGYDLKEIGEKLAENYIKQILEDAFFHADPHPGNIYIRNGKIIWMDMGMMGRLGGHEQEILKKAMLAIAKNDVSSVKDSLLSLGTPAGPIDHVRLYEELDDLLLKYTDMQVRDMNLGIMMEELFGLIKRHDISLSENIIMLGRGIMILQGNLAVLDPEINLAAMFASHMTSQMGNITEKDIKKYIHDGVRSVFSSGRKALDLPAQASDFLRMTMKGRTKINIEQSFSPEAMKKADNIVNKLVLGLIIAALIIGSSMLSAADLTPRIFGIPLIGAIGFSAAAVLLVRLLWIMHKK